MTKTFAIVDDYSGFVWGVAKAADPISACRVIDEDCNEHGRKYEEVSSFSAFNEPGYHVYEVPDGFTVDNGQNADEIATVEAFPRMALVLVKRGDE